MSEIAVIGKPEFILGFELAGIKNTSEVNSQEDTKKILSYLSKDLDILVVDEESLGLMDPEQRKKVEDSARPVVVSLSKQNTSESIRKSIIQAIGVDLWKEG